MTEQTIKATPIRAFLTQHADTVNYLAECGKLTAVRFVTKDGVAHEANSLWAATDWLKAKGFYERKETVRWEI